MKSTPPILEVASRVCRRYWREMIGALVVLFVQIAKMPRTPWENDEFLFAEAVKKFEPTIGAYHPHPPGFPLFVLLGKAMNEIIGDPWRALVILNILAAPVGFVAMARAFRRWIDVLNYERQQARYCGAHDAAMSRGAKSTMEIAIRFVLHGWGSKYLTLPLIVLVVLGLVPAWRRRSAILPVVVFGVTAFIFQLGWMDPADAARYSLSSMFFTALLAAFGLWTIRASTHVRLAPWIVTAIFAAGSYAYVRPIVSEMASKPSPPAAAAAYANAHYPPNTVILWDASLRPAAEYLMPRFKTAALERGLRDYYTDSDVPLVLYTDGGSSAPDEITFPWRHRAGY